MTNDEIKYKLQKAFGWAEDQLLDEWNAAERILKDNPDLREELKAPDDEFEKILKRIEKELKNDSV